MNSKRSLQLLLSAALFLMPISTQSLFQTVRTRSAVAPTVTDSAPGSVSLECASLCALRPACFGFSLLRGLCRFFDLWAFENGTWHSSDECDLHIMLTDKAKLRFISCQQSSVEYGSVCERAIDGVKNQDGKKGFCSHTGKGKSGWWEGQLARPAFISHVTIYNRVDCCMNRLNKLSLIADGVECNRVDLTVPFSVASFTCKAFGSKVRIVNLQDVPLNMCEVEICGR